MGELRKGEEEEGEADPEKRTEEGEVIVLASSPSRECCPQYSEV